MMLSREQLLREMGLAPSWRLRSPPLVADEPAQASAELIDAKTLSSSPSDIAWDELGQAAATCRCCGLCAQRKQAVLGVGDRQADWLFVGEGPGAEEDDRGESFVGEAGKLLDNMLAAIDLKRGADVYITHAVKCRLPDNRAPAADESAACRPYLERQIELLQPKLIVALGRSAAQSLLQTEVNIEAARGQLHHYKDIPVIVAYHPTYLLNNPLVKAKAWEDLCFMRVTMRERKSGC